MSLFTSKLRTTLLKLRAPNSIFRLQALNKSSLSSSTATSNNSTNSFFQNYNSGPNYSPASQIFSLNSNSKFKLNGQLIGSRNFSTSGLKYKSSHEYLKFLNAEKTEAQVGITDYAQRQLGDVVYVDLPEKGDSFKQGEGFGNVESVKAASEVYLPVSGEIIAINEAVLQTPGMVNEDPLEKGWFVKIKIDPKVLKNEMKELLDEDAYVKHCEAEADKDH